MSAFHPEGAYIDPPLHYECMRYAVQACPYIAAPSYAGRIDDRTLREDDRPPLLVDPTMDASRPVVFVAAMATGQKLTGNRLSPYVIPRRPFSRVEYWRHGKLLNAAEGEALVEADRKTWPARVGEIERKRERKTAT
jgi:hypothetical protein